MWKKFTMVRLPVFRMVSAALPILVQSQTLADSLAPVQAKPSDSLVDSMGIVTHFAYTNTPYGNFEELVKPKLNELGIRHVREIVFLGTGPKADSFYQKMRELPSISWNLLTNTRTDLSTLSMLPSWTGGNIEALEGLNEPDDSGDINWVKDTRAWQQSLYTSVKATPALAGVKVLGPSEFYGAELLGDLTPWTDFGNIHPYSGGAIPLINLKHDLEVAKYITGSQPVRATETGYHNAILSTTCSQPPVTEAVSAKYIPRLFLGNFNLGVDRTFLYELVDENESTELTNQESSFGIVRADGSNKPAFTAVRNLISLTQDPGPAFGTGSLTYQLSGTDTNTRSTLLQKRDGSYLLALWEEVPCWNQNIRAPISPAQKMVTISFGNLISNATLYHPDESTSPIGGSQNISTLNVSVTDEVTLITIKPFMGGLVSHQIRSVSDTTPAYSFVNGNGLSLDYERGQLGSNSDQVLLLSAPEAQNVILTAHISSIAPQATAGIMVRQSTSPSASYYAVGASNGQSVAALRASGSPTEFNIAPGSWLKLIRLSSKISAYASPDGITWTLLPHTIFLPGNCEAGLFTSGGSVTFDHVVLNGVPIPLAANTASP